MRRTATVTVGVAAALWIFPAGPPTTAEAAGAVCANRAATRVGTAGADTIFGTSGDDVIAALGGNDTVYALGGNDIICGNAGKDLLKGGDGNDLLKGGKGTDKCRGGPGVDRYRRCESVSEKQSVADTPTCMPGYSPCLPVRDDMDCAEIGHPVIVTGSDPYRLDADGDGVGCEV